MPATTKRTERNKKAVPGSLILARLRIGEIYSLWLYRFSSVVSFIIPHEVESFNSKSFLALLGECKIAAVLNGARKQQLLDEFWRKCPHASPATGSTPSTQFKRSSNVKVHRRLDLCERKARTIIPTSFFRPHFGATYFAANRSST
jgi:hypothetical protein